MDEIVDLLLAVFSSAFVIGLIVFVIGVVIGAVIW